MLARLCCVLPPLAALLGGCATSAGPQPDPALAPASSDFRDAYNYLPVNELPAGTHQPLLTVSEQGRLRAELEAARDRAAKRRGK